jgi:hypothetical protein
MKPLFYPLVATALLASTASVLAASSVDLSVTGLITPSACTPTLSQGGSIDLGKLAAKDLTEDMETELPAITLQLSVNCEAPVLFALQGTDNRPGTAITPDGYGLGLTDAAEKLGAFRLALRNAVADSTRVTALLSADDGVTWQEREYPNTWNRTGLAAFGSNSGGVWTPQAAKELTSDLVVETYISASRDLTLTDEQTIDGSATLEVRYL